MTHRNLFVIAPTEYIVIGKDIGSQTTVGIKQKSQLKHHMAIDRHIRVLPPTKILEP